MSDDGCSVYLIEDRDTGLVKVGISGDPESRVKQLQGQFAGHSGSDLRLVRAARTRSREEARVFEQRVHAAIACHARGGEWFEPEARSFAADMIQWLDWFYGVRDTEQGRVDAADAAIGGACEDAIASGVDHWQVAGLCFCYAFRAALRDWSDENPEPPEETDDRHHG